MKSSKLVERVLLFVVGLCIMAFGVSFSIKAELGISPISSVPYVTSVISGLSVGVTTIIINLLMIALQFVILRKRSTVSMLLQVPATLIFGTVIDIASAVIEPLSWLNYAGQWLFAIISIILIGTGISFEMISNVTTTAGEGLVKVITMVAPIRFGTMKIIFDATLVAISVIASLIFIGTIVGIREGTLAAALLVGTVVKIEKKPFSGLSAFVAVSNAAN